MEDAANFGIISHTRKDINSSVLFEFEVRSGRDPNNLANFKFSTLVSFFNCFYSLKFASSNSTCSL